MSLLQTNTKKKWNIEISFGGIRDTELLFFTRHLALALKSGLTLFEGMDMLQDQSAGKLKKILLNIMEFIKAGHTFYEALNKYPKYFSPLYLNLVRTGELSGNLEKNLYYLADNLKKTRALKQKVKSALMYPTFIFVAVLLLGFSIAVFVLPQIVPLFKTLNVDLPLSTRILIFIADVFEKHGFLIIAGTILGSSFVYWLLRRDFIKPFTHRIILGLPVVGGIAKNVNLEMFTHTLGMLLLSGIPIDSALKITANATDNRVYRQKITICATDIQQGITLSDALNKYQKVFPKMLKHMVAMGEKTGSLDTTLKYLSEFYEDEVDTVMKNLSTIIEPILLVFIGLMVGTVAMAILGPIYKITGNINVK